VRSVKASAVPWSDATNTARTEASGDRRPLRLESPVCDRSERGPLAAERELEIAHDLSRIPGARARSPDWNVGSRRGQDVSGTNTRFPASSIPA
jgi:hypothetical protein